MMFAVTPHYALPMAANCLILWIRVTAVFVIVSPQTGTILAG